MASDRFCRICGESKSKTLNLYENKLNTENLFLHQAFSFVTNLNISNDDGKPDHICCMCYRRLTAAYNLKRQAEKTNLLFENQSIEPKVKEELEQHQEAVKQSSRPIRTRNDLSIQKPVDEFKDTKEFFTQINTFDVMIDNNKPQGSENKESQKSPKKINGTSKNKLYTSKTVKPHKCQVCGHNFLRKSNLVDHLRLHANLKPFQCKLCDKSFVQIANYKTHMRIHTNERPYKCHHCNKSFKQSGSLKVHIRFHTQERNYICDECGKGFTNSSDLSKHKRVHSPDLQMKCDMCEKLFAQKHNLLRHRQKVHQSELEKSNEENVCR